MAATERLSYVERIAEAKKQINAGTLNPGGLSAEKFVQSQIFGELEGQPATGINIAKRNARIMRDDMARFQRDPSQYTQSLGAATGWAARNHMVSAKKKGRLDSVYVYLSGWQIAAMSSDMSPLPDVSAHEKSAVYKTIEDIYQSLRAQDQIELNAIFNQIDKSREVGDDAAVERLIFAVDNYQSHVRPMIADIDAGFGGVGATRELALRMIQAGASAIQIENQVSDEKQCGHQDGKVTEPDEDFGAHIRAVRQAFIECGIPDGIIVARTDSVDGGLTKNLSMGSIFCGASYNDFIAEDPITPENPGKLGDLASWRSDGSFFRAKRLPSGLLEFKPGTGLERAARDAASSFTEYGADSSWIETSSADLQEITGLSDRAQELIAERLVELKAERDAMVKSGRTEEAEALTGHIINIESRPFNITYNNSPSFNWTLKARQKMLAKMQDEGLDVSEYLVDGKPDPKLDSAKYDGTALDELARDYVLEFQPLAAKKARVGHHLITLPEFHGTALIMAQVADAYFGEEGMLGYLDRVQLVELREGRDFVRHQAAAGSDLMDRYKLEAVGSAANIAAGAKNTMHQFGEVSTVITTVGSAPAAPGGAAAAPRGAVLAAA